MVQQKLYFVIIFLTYLSSNFANEFYNKFQQRDYKMDFQRVELIDYNKAVLNYLEIKTFKYNRSQPVVNITLNSKLNMSTDIEEVAVQFYKFLSNEYRRLPGSNFQINLCRSMARNIAGLQIFFKCGNLTTCQIVQDTTYRSCNIRPDESRFPAFIPTGEYRFQMDVMYNVQEIFASTSLYIKVYRPVARPKK